MNDFDLNGNGCRNVDNLYIDYEIVNGSKGSNDGNKHVSGGSGDDGCGCFSTIFMILGLLL